MSKVINLYALKIGYPIWPTAHLSLLQRRALCKTHVDESSRIVHFPKKRFAHRGAYLLPYIQSLFFHSKPEHGFNSVG